MTQLARSRRFVPPFSTGDRMDRQTFHALYVRTPQRFVAELIAGVVHVSTPSASRHSQTRGRLTDWLCGYADQTPGLAALSDATMFLGADSEPQPDLMLRFDPVAIGSQPQRPEDGCVVGPAELVVEVADSPADFELRIKKGDYQRYGVREYLVVVADVGRVVWLTRTGDRLVELTPDVDGLLKSRVFPGLWLDPAAVFARSNRRLTAALRLGLDTPEHADFLAKRAVQEKRRASNKLSAKEAAR